MNCTSRSQNCTREIAGEQSVQQAVRGADIVYHVAAKVTGSGSREYFDTNVTGTECVLNACLKQRVSRLVYLSSLAVYGPAQPGQPITESTPLDATPQARDWYAHSKIVADERTASFARKTGLPVVIVRPGIIFGPGRGRPWRYWDFSSERQASCLANRTLASR